MNGEKLDTCAFSVNVSEWYADRADRLRSWYADREGEFDPDEDRWEFDERFVEDGEWHCYRRTRPGEDYCLFHAHESEAGVDGEDDVEPGQVLRDIVNATTDERLWNEGVEGLWEVPRHPPERDEPFGRDEYKHREKQFVGASLGVVELSHEDLDGPDSYPIDLRLARARSLDFSRSRIGHALVLDGLRQTGAPDDAGDIGGLDEAGETAGTDEEEYGVDLHKSRVEGSFRMIDSRCVDGVRIEEFEAPVTSLDRTRVGGAVSADFVQSGTVYMTAMDVGGDLSLLAASTTESLRLEGVDVDGDLSLKRADADHQIDLAETDVTGDVTLDDVETGNTVFFTDATVGGDVRVKRSAIGHSLLFKRAEVDGEISVKRSSIDARLRFKEGDIGGIAVVYAEIRGEARVYETRVGSDALETNESVEISSTEIRGALQFLDAEFDGAVTVTGTTVASDSRRERLNFEDGDLEITVADSTFHESLTVADSELDSDVMLNARIQEALTVTDTVVNGDFRLFGLQTGGSVSVTETRVEETMRFSTNTAYPASPDLEIGGRVDLSDSVFPELVVDDWTLDHLAVDVVSLEGATVESLRPALQDDDSGPIYDLKDATIEDIPPMRKRDAFRGRNAFEDVRFLGTTFDGFVFSEHREQFRETDWQAHHPRDGGYEDIAIVSQHVSGPGVSNDVVFEVAREVAEAAGGGAVRDSIDEATAGGADEDGEGGPLLEVERPSASTAAHYLDGEWGPAQPATRASGDPFSPLVDLFEWSPDPQHDPSRDWRSVAEERIADLEERVHERLDAERVRRAAALPYSATERVERLVDALEAAIRDPAAGDEPAPTGSLSSDFDTVQAGPLTADRLGAAVARTLASSPSAVSEIAASARETDGRQLANSVPDGGVSDPVATLCETWDVDTGPAVAEFDTAVCDALADAADPIVELAVAMQEDHERLVESGLVSPDDSEDGPDVDGAHSYGALADAIVDRGAVSDAEFVAGELAREEPRYRRVCDRIDVSLEGIEEAVARDLADYRTAMGTNNELESTYALAKNGASEAGDETAAGSFFQREAGYARRQHWHRLGGLGALSKILVALVAAVGALAYGFPDVNGLLSGTLPALSPVAVTSVAFALGCLFLVREELGGFLKWVGNVFLWLTMGYGEKPTRVLGFAAAIVGAFALAYRLLDAGVPPVAGSSDLGHLVFSLDMFVTLALDNPTAGDSLVRLLAVFEGFLGVFVIGMFVVAVTRAVHR